MADGEKKWQQETVVRDTEGGGVAMMAVADDNGDGRGQWQRTTMAMDDNGTQDWAADYNGEGTMVAREMAEAAEW
jgi:hypothetical protein